MKRTAALLAFVVLLTAVAAMANSNADPTIIIRDPVCSGSCSPVGTHFTFSSPKSGSGKIFFTNSSGVNWTSLKLVESGVPSSAITCSTPHTFMNCSVSTNKNGVTTIFLSGVGKGFSGIPSGHNFEISFGGWPKGGVEFTAAANVSAVPEPASLALFITGLGVLVGRKQRKLFR